MRALAALAAGLALFTACAVSPRHAPGPPPAVTAEDEQRLQDAERAQTASTRALESLGVGSVADCGRACTLAANICTLAERICAIAAHYPARDPVAARCADARARCTSADARTRACACRGDDR